MESPVEVRFRRRTSARRGCSEHRLLRRPAILPAVEPLPRNRVRVDRSSLSFPHLGRFCRISAVAHGAALPWPVVIDKESTVIPTIELNDGNHLPTIGLGTYPMDDDQARSAVLSAIDTGYRLIDTAARYGNETGVGRAVADTDIDRDDLFITTKLPGADHGYESTLASFEQSRQRLGVEYVDLYLIHWPLPRIDKYVDSFKAMIKLRGDGLIRSVGVSNFTDEQLKHLIRDTGVRPTVNQIELHPAFNQARMREADTGMDIVTQAWSPLGRGKPVLGHPLVRGIADVHSVTPAQVVLRWEIQLGVVPIPKSSDPDRQRANLAVFDFTLDDEQMRVMSGLETGRTGGDPVNHEEF